MKLNGLVGEIEHFHEGIIADEAVRGGVDPSEVEGPQCELIHASASWISFFSSGDEQCCVELLC